MLHERFVEENSTHFRGKLAYKRGTSESFRSSAVKISYYDQLLQKTGGGADFMRAGAIDNSPRLPSPNTVGHS